MKVALWKAQCGQNLETALILLGQTEIKSCPYMKLLNLRSDMTVFRANDSTVKA